MSAERDHRVAYLRRFRLLSAAWAFLAGALLVLLAVPLRAQEGHAARVILWEEPPTIGFFTKDSSRVYDSLPAIATADWPAFTDTVITELVACSHLTHPLQAWDIRTVAAPLFHVSTWDKKHHKWDSSQDFIGFTFPSVHRIYVAQGGLFVRGLVKHELLHALIADNGLDPRHGRSVANKLFPRCLPGQ